MQFELICGGVRAEVVFVNASTLCSVFRFSIGWAKEFCDFFF